MTGFFGGALLGFGDLHNSLRGSRRFNRRALLDRGLIKSLIGIGIGTLAAKDFEAKLPQD